uniref:Uncharacterized protein n=1 Tax=Oryza punctata TaxID=4537 RepID=A0A0E0LVF5_ORYPU
MGEEEEDPDSLRAFQMIACGNLLDPAVIQFVPNLSFRTATTADAAPPLPPTLPERFFWTICLSTSPHRSLRPTRTGCRNQRTNMSARSVVACLQRGRQSEHHCGNNRVRVRREEGGREKGQAGLGTYFASTIAVDNSGVV